MSVRYKKVMGKGVGSPVANKWYGRAVSMGRVKTADLAEEISHSTTVTRADIMAGHEEAPAKLHDRGA